MSDTSKLCLGCMCEKEHAGPCEQCGYSEDAAYLPSYLEPGTMLAERYIAGKLLHYNGEGATYIGFDTVTASKVTIKEYMPDTLCSRTKGDPQIIVDPNQLPLYKTYMSEFIELNKALMKARGMTHIQTVLDIFPQNNTAYVIFEYINGISLKTYLSNCSGELTWDRVKELFPPILTTLSLVHSAGIIHRGISPQTILVTDKTELKLIDFQISAGRTTNTEIACQMYPGFSAPEQYSSNEWQGTWTDVYGISATLYRVLTGCNPAESIARLGTDNCAEPMVINRSVPSHVSKVIMNGMKLNTSARIQTVTELVIKLFEQPKFNTAEEEPIKPPAPKPVRRVPASAAASIAAQSAAKNAASKKSERMRKKKLRNKILVISTIILCVLIIAGFSITIAILASDTHKADMLDSNSYIPPESEESSEEISSVTETSKPDSSPVSEAEIFMCPNFEGAIFTSIQDNPRYSFLKITASYEFNNNVAAGLVIKQDIKPETEIVGSAEIKLTVSKGPSKIPLPDYKGQDVAAYTAILSNKNIKFETKEIETDEEKPNIVVKCSKEVGEDIDVAHSETVTVYFAKPTGSSGSGNSSADSVTDSSDTDNNGADNNDAGDDTASDEE